MLTFKVADALKSFHTYLASEEDPKVKAKELEIYKRVCIVAWASFTYITDML